MSAIFLDRNSLDNNDMDFSCLESVAPNWKFYDESSHDDTLKRVKYAEILVSNKAKISAQHMSIADKLKLICVAATGTNNIDLDAAKRRGITVCNVRNYATSSVVQHVFALILSLTTRLPDYQLAVKSGRWERSRHFSLLDYSIRELNGKTIGIVGYGTLGTAVAEVARAFGMSVLVAARAGKDKSEDSPDRVPLNELLSRSDVVSLHCPLTHETQGMIGNKELQLMKPDSILINTARGGIVDEVALADAIRLGAISGAGIDVLTEEPPVNGNPLLNLDSPNLIITPHIAWSSVQARQRLLEEIAENIKSFNEGKPRNVVS